MPPIPERLTISDAAVYVGRNHGRDVTRQTVYNWTKRGRRGERLHSYKVCGQLYTTTTAVDEFLSRLHATG